MIDLERLKKVIKEIAHCEVYDRSAYYEHYYKVENKKRKEYLVPCSFETIVCHLFGCESAEDGEDGHVIYSYVNKARDEVEELLPVQDVAQHILGLTNKQSSDLYESIGVEYAEQQKYGKLAERIEDLKYLIKVFNTSAINNKRLGQHLEYLWLAEEDERDKTQGFNITLDGDLYAHIPWAGEWREDNA